MKNLNLLIENASDEKMFEHIQMPKNWLNECPLIFGVSKKKCINILLDGPELFT